MCGPLMSAPAGGQMGDHAEVRELCDVVCGVADDDDPLHGPGFGDGRNCVFEHRDDHLTAFRATEFHPTLGHAEVFLRNDHGPDAGHFLFADDDASGKSRRST